MRSLAIAALLGAFALCTGATSAGAAPATPTANGQSLAKASVVTRSPVRISIPTRGLTRSARVLLNDRDVTKRFARRVGRLVGRLGRRSGLRSGRNIVIVLHRRHQGRGDRRSVESVHTFFLVRRSNRFVRMRVGRGVPVRVRLDVDTDIRRTRRAGRDRRVRIRLNGRDVTKAKRLGPLARYTLSLSGTHGLRHGVNRLDVRVTEARHGRYVLIKRRFRVHRSRPIAAAGYDKPAEPGVRVTLGGRSRAARGGRLRYRWTIVRRPRGSRARLRGVTSKRPRLVPDREGRYRVRLRVSEVRGAGASAVRVGRTGVDDAEVITNPYAKVFQFSANAFAGASRGIKLGDRSYPYPSGAPPGAIQVLWLDRATREPAQLGNTWCCDDDNNTVDDLADRLQSTGGHDHLVVLAIPPQNTVLAGQEDDFNRLLSQRLGVDPLPDSSLDPGPKQTVIVGVPTSPAGTGWAWQRGSAGAASPTQGWLMPDGTVGSSGHFNLRFQPLRLPFSTRTGASGYANTMNIAGQTVNSGGIGPGGFHVVEVDPRDLKVVGNASYTTNGGPVAGLDKELAAMAAYIDGVRANGNYVAVQSVGNAAPLAASWNWRLVSDALQRMNADVDGLNGLDTTRPSTWAFFGGPPLSREEVTQTWSAILRDPTTSPQKFSPGALRGRLTMRHDGYFVPGVGDGAAAARDSSLYDIIFQPDSAWPNSPLASLNGGPSPNTAPIPAAMTSITTQLADTQSAFAGLTDVRKAYRYAQSINVGGGWVAAQGALRKATYPGDGTTCSVPAGKQSSEPGYTRVQFCNLVAELSIEFGWLRDAVDLIGRMKDAFTLSSDGQQADLATLGENIKKATNPPDDSLVAPVLYLLESIAEIGEVFGGPEIAAGAGLLASAYDLGTAASSDSDGVPVGDRVTSKVSQLSADISGRISTTSSALDAILLAAVTDYRRLRQLAAAGEANPIPGGFLQQPLTASALAYFADQLMPIAYWVWDLQPNDENTFPTPDTCTQFLVGARFAGAPDSTYVVYRQGPQASAQAQYPIISYILNEEDTNSGNEPPASLTDPMWKAPSQGGYGMVKTPWFWRKEAIPHRSNFIDCD